jgi:hypothetical protein
MILLIHVDGGSLASLDLCLCRTFNQPASNPVHKLAVNMLRTVSKLLTQHEMMCRHHLYALHPEGAAAAAQEENSLMELDPASDAAWSQSLLLLPPAAGTSKQHEQQQQEGRAAQARPQPSAQQQLHAEDLSAAPTLWQQGSKQQRQLHTASDQGLLFRMQPATSIDSCLQQQRLAVLYQPYAGVQEQPHAHAPAHLQDAQRQQQGGMTQQQQPPLDAMQQQQLPQGGMQPPPDGAQQQHQQQAPPQQQQDSTQQEQQQQQQQQQAGAQPPAQPSAWQQARQPLAWRCRWLHLRMLELQSLVSLLQEPGSSAHSLLAAAAAGSAGGAAGGAAAAAGSTAAAEAQQQQQQQDLPLLQVQRQGKLLKQHVDAVGLSSSIQQGPFFTAQQQAAAGTGPAAAAGQQQQPAQQQSAAPDGNAMDVDQPQQQQFEQQQQKQDPCKSEKQQAQPGATASAAAAAAAPPSSDAAAAATVAAAAAARSSASLICRSVFAAPQHPSDAALLFSSLDLVEKQLVSAKLALGKAFGLDVSWAPPGVRLGQYAAARLQASEGAAAAAAQGQKRSAAAAGLARNQQVGWVCSSRAC